MPADTTSMSQISPRMRIVAGAGLGLIVLLAAFKLLVLSHGSKASPPVPVVHHPVTAVHPTVAAHKATSGVHAKPKAPKVHLDPALPAPLRLALMHSRVVVAVLYAPDAPGDAEAVSEARQGARAAHAGFAMLDVLDETIARAVAQEVDGLSDPAVLVVRRPGTVALKLEGYVDADVVAQAVADTKS